MTGLLGTAGVKWATGRRLGWEEADKDHMQADGPFTT
jgi:hypothetical protein